MILRSMLSSLLLCGALFAVPYKPVSNDIPIIKDIMSNPEDINILYENVDKIYSQSNSFPLNFDSKEEEDYAFADLQKMQSLLMNIKEPELVKEEERNAYSKLLLRKARLYSAANNFGVKDTYNKAEAFYSLLVSYNMFNGFVHNEYGNYLAGMGQIDRAKKEFDWAIDNGDRRALLGMASIFVLEGELNAAQQYLDQYLKEYSHTSYTDFLQNEIKNGGKKIDNFTFRSKAYLTNF